MGLNKMTDEEMKQTIRVSVNVIMDSVIGIIGMDGHSWSSRPCQTCLAVTGLIGRPFGCYWYQENKKRS